jgi:hypothetical protein
LSISCPKTKVAPFIGALPKPARIFGALADSGGNVNGYLEGDEVYKTVVDLIRSDPKDTSAIDEFKGFLCSHGYTLEYSPTEILSETAAIETVNASNLPYINRPIYIPKKEGEKISHSLYFSVLPRQHNLEGYPTRPIIHLSVTKKIGFFTIPNGKQEFWVTEGGAADHIIESIQSFKLGASTKPRINKLDIKTIIKYIDMAIGKIEDSPWVLKEVKKEAQVIPSLLTTKVYLRGLLNK